MDEIGLSTQLYFTTYSSFAADSVETIAVICILVWSLVTKRSTDITLIFMLLVVSSGLLSIVYYATYKPIFVSTSIPTSHQLFEV